MPIFTSNVMLAQPRMTLPVRYFAAASAFEDTDSDDDDGDFDLFDDIKEVFNQEQT